MLTETDSRERTGGTGQLERTVGTGQSGKTDGRKDTTGQEKTRKGQLGQDNQDKTTVARKPGKDS